MLEGLRREVTVNDLCRCEGIKPHSYYSWTKEFMEAGKEKLARDAARDATKQRSSSSSVRTESPSSWWPSFHWGCTAVERQRKWDCDNLMQASSAWG